MHRLLILKTFVLLTGLCPALAAASDAWHTDFEAAKDQAQRTGKPLIVHFWAEWCGPCRQMDSAVLGSPGVKSMLGKDVIGVKVNVDKRQDLSARFGVEQLPTDVILEPTGERMMESTGFRPANEYTAMLKRAKLRQEQLAAQRAQLAQREQEPAAEETPTVLAGQSRTVVMLDGYCPVTLWENRRWVKGSSEFQATYRDQVFQFVSKEAQEAFQQNPRRYSPRFLGCDPVVVWESDKAVPGTTRFGAFYDDELYLFTSAENRDRFKSSPDQFIRTRIVLRPEHLELVVR